MERECMEKINHYCQKQKLTLVYADVSMTGPSHDPVFTIVAKIDGVEYGTGTGKNKKEAKAIAAKKTWEMIEKQTESPSNMQAAELSTTRMTLLPGLSGDYVSQLNLYSQKTLKKIVYTNKCTGDARAPKFSCTCTISGYLYGRGTGPSLAAAKQAAAKQAFEELIEEGAITVGNGTSSSSSTLRDHSNSCQASTQSDLDSNSILCKDSAANLAIKMINMGVCEKPSPSQGNTPSSLKPQRKLAANFDNARDKEKIKKMSDESLPGLDTNTSGENESLYTANKRFLESFKNIEPIGEGGFGNVFKATSKLDERTYAVKRVQFTNDPSLGPNKNVREVKQLAGLDHKNIVRYYSSWKGDDHVTSPASRQKSDKEIIFLFIQMELCEQGTLENWIEKNRQDQKYHEMAQTKVLEILEGVKYIHSKGLIHRDLKPQNIFISDEDNIKIGDFGLATSVTCENLTENTGTKSYMAPEQFGDRYGKEVDIYALGLIWFEILSAFSCHEKTKVWHKVRDGKLPDSFTNQFVTKAPIIKKMLSRDPSGRYPASQILELLKSVDKDKPFRTHTQ